MPKITKKMVDVAEKMGKKLSVGTINVDELTASEGGEIVGELLNAGFSRFTFTTNKDNCKDKDAEKVFSLDATIYR